MPSLQSSDGTDQPAVAGVPKPKPLPKPRPWSIVGVDRKSGEVTSVIKTTADAANADAAQQEHESSKSQATTATTVTSTTSTTKTTSAMSSSMAPPVAAARKSSVRDLINNMNRAGGEKGDKSAETTPTADVFRRKGNSLPRGTTPPTAAAAAASDDKSTTGSSSSPRVAAKAAESTSDDPRILKLDDDFAYDEVLDV